MNPTLKIGEPKYFALRQIIIGNLVSGVFAFFWGIGFGIVFTGIITLFLIPKLLTEPVILLIATTGLIVFGVSVVFWPVMMQLNPYLKYIVGKFSKNDSAPDFTAVCQMSLCPRVYTGIRGFLEDADDIGQLYISQNSLRFMGDHIECLLPFDSIEKIHCRNIGWRALWMYGCRITIDTKAFGNYESLELVERHSNTLISSYRITRRIISLIQKALG